MNLDEINKELCGQGYQILPAGAGYTVCNEEFEELFFAKSIVQALIQIGMSLEKSQHSIS